ncbi:MAG TPA: hypothetical protein VF039_05150 [Longimicrobiales bacterium]
MSAPDFLAAKAAAVRARPQLSPARLDALTRLAIDSPRPASFAAALSAGARVAVIAEYKRRSPSAGPLVDEAPAAVVEGYRAAGARAASVLTDAADFGGSLDDLRVAAPLLPVLRKDFLVRVEDVIEARAAGAAAVLLIAALLDDRELRALVDACTKLSLDALVEVHDGRELARAIGAGARLIGINNRDLRSLRTDLGVTERLAPLAPRGATIVSESGMRTQADVARARDAGARAVLVGESLLVQRGPARSALLRELADVPRAPRPNGAPSFRVKVCGLTSAHDAALAVSCGADALGVVFWPHSRRAVSIDAAADVLADVPPGVARVGVFVDATLEQVVRSVDRCGLNHVQLAGDEPAEFARAIAARTGARIIRTVSVDDAHALARFAGYPADRFLLDAPRAAGHGGTGRAFDPAHARRLPWARQRVIVAGGLRPETVAASLAALRPAAVDVCSGVEAEPGRKDPAALRAFVAAARAYYDIQEIAS